MSQINAEVVQAALASIYDVAADNTQMQSVRISIIKKRVRDLYDQIERQKTDAS